MYLYNKETKIFNDRRRKDNVNIESEWIWGQKLPEVNETRNKFSIRISGGIMALLTP